MAKLIENGIDELENGSKEELREITFPEKKIIRTRCEVWTRVMGYHRPVSNFNTGKKAEHMGRKHFLESVSANTEFCKKYAA